MAGPLSGCDRQIAVPVLVIPGRLCAGNQVKAKMSHHLSGAAPNTTGLLCRVLAERDSEKRAEMMGAIDRRRGASLSRQSAQSTEEVLLPELLPYARL